MPPVSSQLHAKPKSASSFGWRQMAGSAESRFPQWCCTSSPTQRPAAGWGLVLLSSFLSQPACRSHSYDCTVTSACWDHLPHEVDEENCNHRLAGIKNCLVLNSLSLTAVLQDFNTFFFLICSVRIYELVLHYEEPHPCTLLLATLVQEYVIVPPPKKNPKPLNKQKNKHTKKNHHTNRARANLTKQMLAMACPAWVLPAACRIPTCILRAPWGLPALDVVGLERRHERQHLDSRSEHHTFRNAGGVTHALALLLCTFRSI